MISMDFRICKQTVLDTSYPGLSFDKFGVCNLVSDFYDNVKPHWHVGPEGEAQLARMVEKIKQSAKGRDFDCIMGLSGGADSSYMLHVMVTKFGLKPLVFHVDGGWNSEEAVNNINQLVDKLGVDLFTEVIDWGEMRNFQLAMFKSGVPHLDVPQDMAFIAVLYKFAKKYGIKYILNGGNIATECVPRPLKYIYWGTDMVHINDILSRFGSVPMKTFPFSSIYYHKIYLRYVKRIKVFKPLNFMPYNKKEAMEEMETIYGWKPYRQKHFESRFTRFFEGYWLPTRFGFDMRKVDLSSLILTNQKSREEALAELNQPAYDLELIGQDLEYIATKLQISSEELSQYHSAPLKFYWDYKNQNQILEVGEKVLSLITGTRRGGAF